MVDRGHKPTNTVDDTMMFEHCPPCSHACGHGGRSQKSSIARLSSVFTDVVDRRQVVRNIDSFERELLRYGYNTILLQYRYIRYRAITNTAAAYEHS